MRFRRIGVCTLLMAAVCAPMARAQSQAPAGPHFVWKVVKDTKTVAWLVGSVHVLTKDAYPLPPVFERAFGETHTLLEEVDLGSSSDPGALVPFASKAMLTDGRTLTTLLDKDTAALVQTKAVSAGLPMLVVDRMKPWLAAMTLAVPALQRAGYDPSFGLDRHFYDRARAAARPVRGLETVAAQLSALDSLPMPVQIDMLKAVLGDIDTQVGAVADVVRAWRNGDVRALERLLLDEFRESPDVYQRLLVDRNRAWLPQIASCAAEPAPCLVVVGGAHLVGSDSVVAMLRQAGFSVEQQ